MCFSHNAMKCQVFCPLFGYYSLDTNFFICFIFFCYCTLFYCLQEHLHGHFDWLSLFVIWTLTFRSFLHSAVSKCWRFTKGIKGLKRGFHGHQVQIFGALFWTLCEKHDLLLWHFVPSPSLRGVLKGPSDSLVNVGREETKSMQSISAALVSWMKMGFELQPFCHTKLEGANASNLKHALGKDLSPKCDLDSSKSRFTSSVDASQWGFL